MFYYTVPCNSCSLFLSPFALGLKKGHVWVCSVPSPEQTNWGGTSRKWGGTLKYTELFVYRNWYSDLVLQQLCAILKWGQQRFFISFRLKPIIALKIYIQQWMLLDVQPEFCYLGWTQSKFICQKIARFSPGVEQTNTTQAYHRRGIVSKYLVAVDGGLGAEPPAARRFLWFCCKKIPISTAF